MVTSVRCARIAFVMASSLLARFASTDPVRAEEWPVVLACVPTFDAMDKCAFAGGHFDSQHCKCLGAPSKRPPTCSLVCFNGELDAARCKCVPFKL
jgi:hypothetical protein